MRILVTGGAGFIGSHIVDAYLADGHQVAALDNLESGSLQNLDSRATFYQADLRDAEAVRHALSEFRPDVVSHQAAQVSVVRSTEEPTSDAGTNIMGSLNAWEAARAAGVKRFIFASSGGAIYGHSDILPTPETFPPAPLSPYGLSKWAFEKYLTLLQKFDGPVPVLLRYANVYGPRQGSRGEAGVISIFARRLHCGEPCTVYGDGSMTRDYVYVADVVEANRLAITQGDGEAFNIGTGKQTSTLQLYQLLQRITGNGPESPYHASEREGEVRHSCLNADKARQQLGRKPMWSLEDGLPHVVEGVRLEVARDGCA